MATECSNEVTTEGNDDDTSGFQERDFANSTTITYEGSHLKTKQASNAFVDNTTTTTSTGTLAAFSSKQQELEILQNRKEVLKLELELIKAKLLLSQSQTQQPVDINATSNSVRMQLQTSKGISNSTRSDQMISAAAVATNEINSSPASVQYNIRELITIAPGFNPSNKISVSSAQWVKKIEELREVYGISDKATLLLASSKLEGAAKFWLEGCQARIKTWLDMKTGILFAFPPMHDESEVHMLLSKRRKTSNETFENYFFEMISIASRASLSNAAVIKYLINGITDRDLRMSLSLQKFESPQELLRQYKQWEDITRFSAEPRVQIKKHEEAGNAKKCFNCNELGHISVNCPKPQKRPRCSQCNKPGHNETQCKTTNSVKRTVALVKRDEYHKTVSINGQHTAIAFIDMGSDISLMKKSFAKICQLVSQPSKVMLRGFGNGKCYTTGKVNVKLTVDEAVADVDIFLVEDEFMTTDLIVGRDFIDLSHVNVIKRHNELLVTNVSSDRSDCRDEDTITHQSEDEFSGNENPILRSVATENCEPVTRDVTPWKHNDSTSPTIIEEIQEFEVNCKDLNAQQRKHLLLLLNRHRNCFAKNLSELGCSQSVELNINLCNTNIINCRPYRLGYFERDKVKIIVQELLSAEIIRHSNSPYSSPALLVKKKDGDYRMVVDYRRINEVTVKDRHPLPVIEDLLQQLNGSKFFIALDLASGYYQIPIAENSRKFTAFVTPDGEYEFLRMPFGLSNCPSVFQRLMNNLCRQMHKGNIVVYMDDILIPCKTFEHGLEILTEFLTILKTEGLTLKLKKSYFFESNIEFLGYNISAEGIQPNEQKISAVSNFKKPKDVHELRRFLGLTSYFRKFVPEHAIIAHPLTKLLRKEADFVWNDEQEKAFLKLKGILTSRPLLALYDPRMEHEVHTDACSVGLAGILLQREGNCTLRPVTYFSRRRS